VYYIEVEIVYFKCKITKQLHCCVLILQYFKTKPNITTTEHLHCSTNIAVSTLIIL